jgi:hypothetical protein
MLSLHPERLDDPARRERRNRLGIGGRADIVMAVARIFSLRLIDVHASAIRAFCEQLHTSLLLAGLFGRHAAPQWRSYLELEMLKKYPYLGEAIFITTLVLSVAYLWYDVAFAHHIIL